MTNMKWEDPGPDRRSAGPGPRGTRAKYVAEAAELKAHPGRWALLETDVAAGAAAMRCRAARVNSGKAAAFRDGGFEAVTRVKDGWARMYVRYTGE